MLKFFEILFAGILTSCYFFPFEFYALPGINTKMVLAVFGLACAVYHLVKKRSFSLPQELLWLIVIASSVSVISLLSITFNHTPDTTYVSYIVSFSVWLSAAFALSCVIHGVHGGISVQICIDYLIGVCLFQCVFAILIQNVTAIRLFIDRYFALDQPLLHEINRLYGIGASLDMAGARYSAVLAAMGFYLSEIAEPLSDKRRILYITAFIVITVIGNMIARTTLIGTLLGLGIILIGFLFKPTLPGENYKVTSFLTWMIILTAGITACVVLYNTDPAARNLFRFGFEGFFSLAEKGHWETSSTNKLVEGMIVFPETLKTWVIGDGYFLNAVLDANYLGSSTKYGFYMGTDVGYLRFIFYFGILGLIPMMGVIVYSAAVCMRHFPQDRLLFLLALLVGLIVWFKVSTDIFCFFALFLSAAALKTPSTAQA